MDSPGKLMTRDEMRRIATERIGTSGYELTFTDFCRLVQGPSYRQVLAGLLCTWFQYEIVGFDADTVIQSGLQETVSLQTLWLTIQSDKQKQYELYQRAMDFWR
ncbi:hypothetical protein ACFPT7_16625 [Acidicapsa dinghuensis]|uniref:Uncharacterized protein n=1 Tax=Acidicapsa dinghuensis TaxID=2218256 RepID=A0ABW1EI16_9BACT|nr:hypothetical protein [Acidicapsa dinghuensis]